MKVFHTRLVCEFSLKYFTENFWIRKSSVSIYIFLLTSFSIWENKKINKKPWKKYFSVSSFGIINSGLLFTSKKKKKKKNIWQKYDSQHLESVKSGKVHFPNSFSFLNINKYLTHLGPSHDSKNIVKASLQWNNAVQASTIPYDITGKPKVFRNCKINEQI